MNEIYSHGEMLKLERWKKSAVQFSIDNFEPNRAVLKTGKEKMSVDELRKKYCSIEQLHAEEENPTKTATKTTTTKEEYTRNHHSLNEWNASELHSQIERHRRERRKKKQYKNVKQQRRRTWNRNYTPPTTYHWLHCNRPIECSERKTKYHHV